MRAAGLGGKGQHTLQGAGRSMVLCRWCDQVFVPFTLASSLDMDASYTQPERRRLAFART
jgi:hypothetical protein